MKRKRVLALSVFISFVLAVAGWKIFFTFRERGKELLLPSGMSQDIKQEKEKFQPYLSEKSGADKEVSIADNEKKMPMEPLTLELLGTIRGGSKNARAVIMDLETKKQGIYRLGDSIRQAKIVDILIGEVILERNGQKEVLRLSMGNRDWVKDYQIITELGDYIVVNKPGLLNAVSNLNLYETLGRIKVKSYYESGKVVGVMLDGIDEGSIIELAEFRNKDIITTVNGQKINSYQKALQVMKKAKNQSKIKVRLLRDGQVKMLNYRLRYQ